MFDELVTTRLAPDGSTKVERVPDEVFADACRDFLIADEKYALATLHVKMDDYASVCGCLDSLGRRYECEKKMWSLFMGASESVPAMQRLYMRFRSALIKGESLQPNA